MEAASFSFAYSTNIFPARTEAEVIVLGTREALKYLLEAIHRDAFFFRAFDGNETSCSERAPGMPTCKTGRLGTYFDQPFRRPCIVVTKLVHLFLCLQEVCVSGSLAPFDEVSVAFRGPMNLHNIAWYEGSATETLERVSSWAPGYVHLAVELDYAMK